MTRFRRSPFWAHGILAASFIACSWGPASAQPREPAGCAQCEAIARAMTQADRILGCQDEGPREDPARDAIAILSAAIDAAAKSSDAQAMAAKAMAEKRKDTLIQLRDKDWKTAFDTASELHSKAFQDQAENALGKFASTAPTCWNRLAELREKIAFAQRESKRLTEEGKRLKDAGDCAGAQEKFKEALTYNADNMEARRLRAPCPAPAVARKRCRALCKVIIVAALSAGGWQGYEYYMRNRPVKVGITPGAITFGAPQ